MLVEAQPQTTGCTACRWESPTRRIRRRRMAKALTPRVGLASMARLVTGAVLAWVSSTRVGQTRVASMMSGVEPLGLPGRVNLSV